MVRRESRPNTISHITLGTKQTGAPSAGNLHAGCDVAGAGNGFAVWLLRHSQRKRGATARLDLRNTAPVLDPTGIQVVTPKAKRAANEYWSRWAFMGRIPKSQPTSVLPVAWEDCQRLSEADLPEVSGPPVAVHSMGQRADTHCRVSSSFGKISNWRLVPESGRVCRSASFAQSSSLPRRLDSPHG